LRNLRFESVFALFAMVWTGFGAGFSVAWAGAWLLPAGDGQIITYTDYSDSTLAFNAQGKLIQVPAYQKFEIGSYLEYGVTDWLTIVAAPAYDRIRSPAPGQSYTGPGESEFAARLQIFRSDEAVFSVQAGLRTPGASFDSLGPLEVRRAASLDLRGMAGKNCVIAEMDCFVEAEGGYRIYAQNQPGEWRIDLTAGLRPLPRLLFLLQGFTSISNGAGPFGHVSWTKLQPSLVYDIAPQWSLQLGGFWTVAGVNAGRELGPAAGIWYRF
jgi:protein XagA